jgi:hypothetical protein
MVDATGEPLAIALTSGKRNDITQLLPLVDGIAPVAGRVGPTGRCRLGLVCAHI